jgi:hypothetical protein
VHFNLLGWHRIQLLGWHKLQMIDKSCILTGMPKNKSRRRGAKATTGGADDNEDFDKMLAEVTSADTQLPADVPTSTATTANIAFRQQQQQQAV